MATNKDNTHQMIMKQIFRGKSLCAILAGWAAIFLPFLLCLFIQKSNLAYLQTGMLVGLAGSMALFFLLALPALYYLRRGNMDSLGAYTRIPALWVMVLSISLGLTAMTITLFGETGLIWWHSLFATALIGCVMMIFPAWLWALSYWFLAIRPDRADQNGAMGAVTGFSALFVIWSLFCFLIAANWAVLLGN